MLKGAEQREIVFPAGAGVFLSGNPRPCGFFCVPRRCGGVPLCSLFSSAGGSCSPQVRGCSSGVRFSPRKTSVFPAGAGVFPQVRETELTRLCVPRRCGGVPDVKNDVRGGAECSPQVRGCSPTTCLFCFCTSVFPAGAGVFLHRRRYTIQLNGVPRRCGGVPSRLLLMSFIRLCSPQVRGCSELSHNPTPCRIVFPAGAGVFPLILFLLHF